MKQFVSVLLTLMMVLGLCIGTAADDVTTLTIEDTIEAGERTYEGYKLLRLITGLKTGEYHPENCNGTDHTEECYNYSYEVNEKYRSILQKEAYNQAENGFWGTEGKPASVSAVTDKQILDYIASLTGDSSGTFGTLRTMADRIYSTELKNNSGMEPDVTGITGTGRIDQGYWMFADVTSADLMEEDALSLVIVDTKGQDKITIVPKTSIPTVEKKVKDIDDSEDDDILDNSWVDAADHDIGDTVPFKLTATLPGNAQYYQSYQIIFHDTLAPGLVPTDDEEWDGFIDSFKVLMYATKNQADADTDLDNFTKDVTAYFSVNTDDLDDDCTFEVICDNVCGISGVTKDTVFVVYYEAKLNEDAVIGADGNPNTVYLEFSNDPYSDGTGRTTTDEVIVFTYQLTINKVDSHNNPLAGAEFTLTKITVNGETTIEGDVSEDGTTFIWKGLDDGDYRLSETVTPDGYNALDDIEFSITAEHSETADEPALISLDGGDMGSGNVDTGVIEKAVINNTGTVLPETGAGGTALLIGISSMIVLAAVVMMVVRKKMSVYED